MSLRAVMPELVRAYEAQRPGTAITVTYGASGDLEREVQAGAPIDAVILAAGRPVDELIHEGRAASASRRVVASNELVLVGRKGGPSLTFATLTAIPDGERVAVGDPRVVPAGEYARDYLRGLGEWDALSDRLLLGSNVAAVLVYARRGEAVAGVVYRTELRDVDGLVVLDVARGPVAPHPEIVAATILGGQHEADDFLTFVASPAGAAVFDSFGFGPR
jgi:molybdate transport system substrate-binding protein